MKAKQYPDKILNQKCKEVTDFTSVGSLAQKLLALCANKKRKGVGAAAPQVGSDLRVFVTLVDKKPMVFVNPELKGVSVAENNASESCLSFSKVVSYPITRSSEITLKWQNLKGEVKEDKFEGFMARVIQHELDHLNGITMYDRWEMQK